MRQARILMCPPDYYGIEYEINPWMSRSRGSTPERARQQWTALCDLLRGLGVTLERMTPQPGLPDLVFTANAGLVFRQRFFSSRFRHEVRARESPHFDAWFAAHGFTVEHLPEGMRGPDTFKLFSLHMDLFFDPRDAEWTPGDGPRPSCEPTAWPAPWRFP